MSLMNVFNKPHIRKMTSPQVTAECVSWLIETADL